MEIADSNLKGPGPRSGASQSGTSRVAKESAIGKRVVVGIGLLVLAIVLWSLRDTVPSWMAKSMAATVELATTSERDDARVARAFDAAMHVYSADAMLESLPNQIRVRHTRLTVRAPSPRKDRPRCRSMCATAPRRSRIPRRRPRAMRCASAPRSRAFWACC
jgi:hypothetical protein